MVQLTCMYFIFKGTNNFHSKTNHYPCLGHQITQKGIIDSFDLCFNLINDVLKYNMHGNESECLKIYKDFDVLLFLISRFVR